jgi:RNA polymerase sigma-70 factor (ECF subfamily)
MDNGVTPELLERLLNEYGAALTLFAAQWSAAPEDCVQEAFLQLVRQSRLPERVVPWLYRVVRNRAISERRSAIRRAGYEALAAGQRPSWFFPATDSLGIDDVRLTHVLESLPEEYREVIVGRIWGNLGFEQLAEVVEVSRSTAHRRYEEGIRILRERLKIECKPHNPARSRTGSTSG